MLIRDLQKRIYPKDSEIYDVYLTYEDYRTKRKESLEKPLDNPDYYGSDLGDGYVRNHALGIEKPEIVRFFEEMGAIIKKDNVWYVHSGTPVGEEYSKFKGSTTLVREYFGTIEELKGENVKIAMAPLMIEILKFYNSRILAIEG